MCLHHHVEEWQLHVFTDDMLIAYKDKTQVLKMKNQLSFEFAMKDLGPASKILAWI